MKIIGKLIQFWLILALVSISAYFGYSNGHSIDIQLPIIFEGTLSIPAYKLFIGSILLGAMLTSLHFGFDSMKKSLTIRRLKKQIKQLPESEASYGGDTATASSPAINSDSDYSSSSSTSEQGTEAPV